VGSRAARLGSEGGKFRIMAHLDWGQAHGHWSNVAVKTPLGRRSLRIGIRGASSGMRGLLSLEAVCMGSEFVKGGPVLYCQGDAMRRPTLQVPSIPITKRGRQGRMCPIGKHDTTLRMGALRSMLASKNSGRKNMPIALQYPGRICSVLPPLPKFKPTRGTSVFGVRLNALH